MTILLAVGIPLIVSGGIGGYYFIKNQMKKSLASKAILSLEELEDKKPYTRSV